MLTYPDRQKFEEIRARWETAQRSEEGQVEMAGWRDRPVPQQPTSVESQENGSSKFRRKLSHGFSRISNPLSQRKVTPRRTQLEAHPPVTEPLTTDVIIATFECDAPVLPAQESTSLIDLTKVAKGESEQLGTNGPSKGTDTHTTPRPLPRSRTLSFIPVPVKIQPNIFAADNDGAVKVDLLGSMSPPESESIPTKIPSPSPEIYQHRCYSPRRYLHHHASYEAPHQTKRTITSHNLTRTNEISPANTSRLLQPCTMHNVVKGPNKPPTAGFMAPRKPGPRRSVASPKFQKPVLQENIPTENSFINRRSQIQEKALKRESLAVPGILHDRRSFGRSTPVMQGRGASFATPPTTSKRIIPHNSQNTPVTAKRIQRDNQVQSHTPNRPTMKPDTVSKSSLLSTSRASILNGVEISKQSLIRSCTQTDLSMETPSTLNGLGGVSRLNGALGAVNHEVSKFPRSQTFHNFGAQPEDAPPVPPLPIKYRKSSLSDLTRQCRIMYDTPTKPGHGKTVSDASLCIVEESSEETAERDSTTDRVEAESAPSRSGTPTSSTVSSTVFPLVSNIPHYTKLGTASARSVTTQSSQGTPDGSSGDVREQEMPDGANNAVLQVEDYMPVLYWAGRFQSRYDQWRTDAMNAELGVHSDRQSSSPMSEYKLDQEHLAACYIFAQLRNLCGSDRATDGLWEFEYKYRKDNKLLNNPAGLPTKPLSKRESKPAPTETETGAFGRAIKKLTPRKSSFANLMKGKGWNKADELKQHNRSGYS